MRSGHHLDKVYWPEDGYTKRDLIDYYYSVLPYILPHLKDDSVAGPLPGGVEGEGSSEGRASGCPIG